MSNLVFALAFAKPSAALIDLDPIVVESGLWSMSGTGESVDVALFLLLIVMAFKYRPEMVHHNRCSVSRVVRDTAETILGRSRGLIQLLMWWQEKSLVADDRRRVQVDQCQYWWQL